MRLDLTNEIHDQLYHPKFQTWLVKLSYDMMTKHGEAWTEGPNDGRGATEVFESIDPGVQSVVVYQCDKPDMLYLKGGGNWLSIHLSPCDLPDFPYDAKPRLTQTMLSQAFRGLQVIVDHERAEPFADRLPKPNQRRAAQDDSPVKPGWTATKYGLEYRYNPETDDSEYALQKHQLADCYADFYDTLTHVIGKGWPGHDDAQFVEEWKKAMKRHRIPIDEGKLSRALVRCKRIATEIAFARIRRNGAVIS